MQSAELFMLWFYEIRDSIVTCECPNRVELIPRPRIDKHIFRSSVHNYARIAIAAIVPRLPLLVLIQYTGS